MKLMQVLQSREGQPEVMPSLINLYQTQGGRNIATPIHYWISTKSSLKIRTFVHRIASARLMIRLNTFVNFWKLLVLLHTGTYTCRYSTSEVVTI